MGLFHSARRPVNMKLVRRTSLETSRLMFSKVPGFDRPNASRRSRNDR